jgi:hypothetical protein
LPFKLSGVATMAWSAFCTKLAEVFDRHLGNISRPSQIVKEAAAEGDALRLLAAAERDAELIRRGELEIQLPPGLNRLPALPADPAQQLTYGQQIAARIVHQELKRDQNLEKIAYYATEEEGDGNVAQEHDVDEDWLAQFFRNAQDVSTEQLQRLWARLLTGEIKHPGTYSIDTMDFLRRLTTARAQQIAQIGPYLFAGDAIVLTDVVTNQPWSTFVFWLDLENLGIINRNLAKTIGSTTPKRFENGFVYNEKVLPCRADANDLIIKLTTHRVTELGIQVLSLSRFKPNYEYFMSVAHEIKKDGVTVYVGDLVERSPGYIRHRNLVAVA